MLVENGVFSFIKSRLTLANLDLVVLFSWHQPELLSRDDSGTKNAAYLLNLLFFEWPWVFVGPAAEHHSLEVVNAVCVREALLESMASLHF